MIGASVGASTLVVKMKKDKGSEGDRRSTMPRKKEEEGRRLSSIDALAVAELVRFQTIPWSVFLFLPLAWSQPMSSFCVSPSLSGWSPWPALGEEGEGWSTLDGRNSCCKAHRLVTVRPILIQVSCSPFQSIIQFSRKASSVTFRSKSKSKWEQFSSVQLKVTFDFSQNRTGLLT